MRILHVYKTFYPDSLGGVEQAILQLAQGMVPLGINTNVLTLSNSPNQATDVLGCKVHRVKTHLTLASTSFSLAAFSKFRDLLKITDLVHYHFPYPFMDMLHCTTNVRCPSVVTYHSDIVKQKNWLKLYQPLMHRFLKQTDALVATSPNYVATSPILQRYQTKTHVIPMGLPDMTAHPVNPSVLAHWQAKLPARFFLFVGVLRYYKGLHILLDALAAASYPVVIVGEGPEETTLKARVEQLRLKHIYFVGAVDDANKYALLTLCYAFLFPSHLRSEAFGLSLLEAAMCEKAMVSCEIGTGTTYINQMNQTGIVVPPNDPIVLANALHRLWDNPSQTEAMGKAARQHYLAHFTSQQMIEAYVSLYHRLLK